MIPSTIFLSHSGSRMTSRSAEAASNHMGDAHEGGTEPLQDIEEQL